MVLKSVPFAFAVALVLAWGGIARADDYKPDEYLGLDLSKAVLSPKRLGPETQFAPVALEAKGGNEAQARAEPVAVPKKVAAERVRVPDPKIAHAQPRGAARTRLAHRHGNPLDAQAMDTRIQTLAVPFRRHLQLAALTLASFASSPRLHGERSDHACDPGEEVQSPRCSPVRMHAPTVPNRVLSARRRSSRPSSASGARERIVLGGSTSHVIPSSQNRRREVKKP